MFEFWISVKMDGNVLIHKIIRNVKLLKMRNVKITAGSKNVIVKNAYIRLMAMTAWTI